MAPTGTLAVVPSGNVTFAVEAGSPVPDTVSVPLAFGVVVTVGATGAEVSVNGFVAAVETLPAGSVTVAVTGP